MFKLNMVKSSPKGTLDNLNQSLRSGTTIPKIEYGRMEVFNLLDIVIQKCSEAQGPEKAILHFGPKFSYLPVTSTLSSEIDDDNPFSCNYEERICRGW